jgi:hypothetical protein
MKYVCQTCSYPSSKSDSCDNPACLANPDLSEAHKAKLIAAEKKRIADEAEFKAIMAMKDRLRKQGFTPTF